MKTLFLGKLPELHEEGLGPGHPGDLPPVPDDAHEPHGPGPPATGRRRLATDEFDKVIIAAAPEHGKAFRARRRGVFVLGCGRRRSAGNALRVIAANGFRSDCGGFRGLLEKSLEYCFRIVVETADEARIQGVGYLHLLEELEEEPEVIPACLAEFVQKLRRPLADHRTPLLFAIEEPQGIFPEALLAVAAEPAKPRAVVRGELRTVGTAADWAADAVHLNEIILDVPILEEEGEHADDLGIRHRALVAHDLKTPLMKLAVPTALGLVVAEERIKVVELHRLRQVHHPVLCVRARYRSRSLGAERQRVAAARFERIRLLGDDVGVAADAGDEE